MASKYSMARINNCDTLTQDIMLQKKLLFLDTLCFHLNSLFISLIVLSSSCCQSNKKNRVVFVLPANYQGIFYIKPSDDTNYIEKNKTDEVVIKVPKNGIATTSYYSILSSWHTEEVRIPDGGSVGLRNLYNLGSTEKYTIYFYGTEKLYEAKIRHKSPLDLQPGIILDD